MLTAEIAIFDAKMSYIDDSVSSAVARTRRVWPAHGAGMTIRRGNSTPKGKFLFILCCIVPCTAIAGSPITAPYTTPAALDDQADLCAPANASYPKQWEWQLHAITPTPRSATTADNLQPRVVQHRMVGGHDTIIANYNELGGDDYCYAPNMNMPGTLRPQCGPFPREPYRTWLPGDVFMVYPAVYSGDLNNPWFGQQVDTYAQYLASNATPPSFTPFVPTDITIQGVVENGIRPVVEFQSGQGATNSTYSQSAVYFGPSSGVTWDNIDVVAAPGYTGAKAGIYIVGARNLTISNTRVIGFHNPDAMGILGGEADPTPGSLANNSGTLSLLNDELGFNGGVTSAANHNAYIGYSATDPNFKVVVRNMWSHDSFYGHLLKIRAQNADVQGSYFEGSVPSGGFAQTEAYLLDFPNGGNLVVKNNVFAKNASGLFSNGMSLTYAMEGVPDKRSLSIDYENNTFVAFTEYFDGSHPVYPMGFFYPNIVPGTPGFPVVAVTVKNNAFVGYCPQNNTAMDYRGDMSVTEGFSELLQTFSLRDKFVPPSGGTSNVGLPAYQHVTQPGLVRTTPVIGAED